MNTSENYYIQLFQQNRILNYHISIKCSLMHGCGTHKFPCFMLRAVGARGTTNPNEVA